ncbi:MAG TPA: protein-export chaperone SecB [Candidatus Elarobacter sp.]|nr:protein-export chaperone SecB [Candidatus Elarobacter sp.]
MDQIFLDHARFSHREDYLAHPPSTSVDAALDISVDAGLTADGTKARIQVIVATDPEADALYSFEIGLTALLERIDGEENVPLDWYVQANGPALLFPFVREAVANLTGRGRFGPVWLHPVNVLAMTEAVDDREGGDQGGTSRP